MDNLIQNRLDLYINAKLAIKAMRLEEFICTLNDQDIAVLKMLVKQIVGNDENSRYAVVEFEGDEIKIVKNQVIKGKIKVVDIFSDRVVVYSVSEQRRHTYRLVTE